MYVTNDFNQSNKKKKLTFEDISSKEDFLNKHYYSIKKDKRYIFQFYYRLGLDWLRLGNFDRAKKYFWQAFLAWPLSMDSLLKVINLNIMTNPYGYSSFKRNSALKKLIKNQRVLIIGSGPSANELTYIPDDIKVFTCNVGPRILLEKKLNKAIDLYYCAKGVISGNHKNENVIDILLKFKIGLFIISGNELNKKNSKHKELYDKCIDAYHKDKGINNYYLNKLIGPDKTEEIKRYALSNNRTSAGLRLLQYALFFKARQIYLVGIDISEGGYFWGRNNIHEHLHIDKKFIGIVSKKYNNIYSAAEKSPILNYIKYRAL